MIDRFFKSRSAADELGPLVRPRRPFRPGRIRSWDCRSINHSMLELDQLSDPITDMEDDGKGIPILLKHYSRLGGRLLGFNVDPKFSHVPDWICARRNLPRSSATWENRLGGLPTASRIADSAGSLLSASQNRLGRAFLLAALKREIVQVIFEALSKGPWPKLFQFSSPPSLSSAYLSVLGGIKS